MNFRHYLHMITVQNVNDLIILEKSCVPVVYRVEKWEDAIHLLSQETDELRTQELERKNFTIPNRFVGWDILSVGRQLFCLKVLPFVRFHFVCGSRNTCPVC